MRLALAYPGTPVGWWMGLEDERLIATAIDEAPKEE